jgi:hypothetical protein
MRRALLSKRRVARGVHPYPHFYLETYTTLTVTGGTERKTRCSELKKGARRWVCGLPEAVNTPSEAVNALPEAVDTLPEAVYLPHGSS